MGTLRFWLNAFIPRDVAGYTETLKTGPHSGKTAVPLPGIARLHPLNTFKDWNAGYLTDQRGFDDSYGASSRMTSMIEIETTTLALKQAHSSSGTTQINIKSGDQTGFAVAKIDRCAFAKVAVPRAHAVATGSPRFPRVNYPSQYTGITELRFRLEAAAGDPLVWAAADINYEGELNVAILPTGVITVDFDGLLDSFPAYDCYASYGGKTGALFKSSPPKGNTVTNLPGNANRPIRGSLAFT